jgi:small GTP-binding protein
MTDKEEEGGEEEEIKVILVGEMGTGKTSLINTAIGLKFQDKIASTTTNSIVNKKMEIKDKTYSINLWDTIGQEKYRSLTKIFMKGAKIVIFVYDITNYDSFKELNFWIESTKEILTEQPVMGIVGNKSDLFLKEEVKESEARQLAKDKGYEFSLTSAKNSAIFCEFLEKLIKMYLGEEIDDDDDDDKAKKKGEKLKVGNIKTKGKKGCC